MNKIIETIPPSVSLSITSKAKALVAAGESVCSFAAGEPDFDTPAVIKAAAAEALERGETKYTPASGAVKLREAIAEKLERENGLVYTPQQIIVSNGAKHSLFNVFMAMLNPGDEVLIPAPYWLSYPEMVKIAGGVPVVVETEEARDFKVTPEAVEASITDQTVAIVINTPSNPIGIVYSGEELSALADVALKHNLWIISDEIYEKMVYDNVEHVSVGSFSDDVLARTVTVNGFSKAYSMTGWRLGYFAAPMPLVKVAGTLQSHSTSGPNTFAQFGGVAALTSAASDVAEMVAAFSDRREFMYERLSAIDGVTCVNPQGAFYMLPNIASFGVDSVTFASRLLEEAGVAVVPGAAFGADGNVRMSYACSKENIEEGVSRLAAFVAKL
ncbi:MAG: pyridoxal phosphate-dependent aminotransferase [Verrucomicrobia bacterium]|jgi:aspartate aminotransferase|nr:pyridoxal phosphate-dependent aminotransferase [Verrucomicrobiota bacterium]